MEDRRRRTWRKRAERYSGGVREAEVEEKKQERETGVLGLEEATKELIAAILNTEEYQAYQAELAKVKRFPGLKEQIDNFRTRNYEFQMNPDKDFNMLERFEKEYANFRENPMVADFLAAELAFCRLMQGLAAQIVSTINFE